MNLNKTFIELHSQGLTHRQIAETLNDSGVPAQSGGEWTRDAARNYWRRNVNTDMTDRKTAQSDWQAPNRRSAIETSQSRVDRAIVKGVSEIDDFANAISYALNYTTEPKPTIPDIDVVATLEKTGVGTVLVIPDTHEPFSIDGFAEWCVEQRDRWGCDTVVHIGDLVDNYASSMHGKDPDNPDAISEYERALERLSKWFSLFPEAILTLGNHDDRPMRTAKAGGVSSVFMKSFRETWNIPVTWQICQEAILDNVMYVHHGGGGRSPSLARALAELIPVVSGHYHTCGGVAYHAGRNHTLWGLDVGCGVDRTGYGLAYNKSLRGYILGCGIVVNDNGVHVPHFIPYTPK